MDEDIDEDFEFRLNFVNASKEITPSAFCQFIPFVAKIPRRYIARFYVPIYDIKDVLEKSWEIWKDTLQTLKISFEEYQNGYFMD